MEPAVAIAGVGAAISIITAWRAVRKAESGVINPVLQDQAVRTRTSGSPRPTQRDEPDVWDEWLLAVTAEDRARRVQRGESIDVDELRRRLS